MCVNPIVVENEELPCRDCWQCKSNRVNDWVGRCIAESKTATKAYVVTLTYGGDDHYGAVVPEATVLSYSDIQGYLKRLRKWTRGTIRFFVTGEFGSAKGRAHWHMIVFVYGGDIPNLRLWERYIHDDGRKHALWDNGWSYWDVCDVKSIRYVVKYLLKQEETAAIKAMGLSTKPPLGDEYFRNEAQRYVDAGLSPRDLFYFFPQAVRKDGKPMRFKLAGAPAFNFLKAFDERWQLRHGNELWPWSELMDAYVDVRDRLNLRAQGKPDFPEDYFLERMDMEALEKGGQWWRHVEEKKSGEWLVRHSQKSVVRPRTLDQSLTALEAKGSRRRSSRR